MITGFNTDVKHKTKVYHVQTEDKGRENPKIETLVYHGGEILDSIKIPYDNDPPLPEKEISKMMEGQHKKIIRNIKIGKFDDPSDDKWDLGDHSLDEAVLAYLSENQTQEKIEIIVEGLETLVPGGKSSLKFKITHGTSTSSSPVEMAKIRVKLMCPKNTPRVIGKGETNSDGIMQIPINLPIDSITSECSLKIQVFSVEGTAEKQFLLA